MSRSLPTPTSLCECFSPARGGGRKGDLSHFIEEAVKAHNLELTAEQAKSGNAGLSEEALQWARKS